MALNLFSVKKVLAGTEFMPRAEAGMRGALRITFTPFNRFDLKWRLVSVSAELSVLSYLLRNVLSDTPWSQNLGPARWARSVLEKTRNAAIESSLRWRKMQGKSHACCMVGN